MRKLFWSIILMCCFSVATFANPQTREPANPRTSQPVNPQHIISLKPNITEILFALGAGDQVVGVTTWCDWPIEAKKLPKVANYTNINPEKIIALKPDLVIGSEENAIKSQFAVLHNAKIKTLTVPFRTMDDLYGSIAKIAEAVGKKAEGKTLTKNINNEIRRGVDHPPLNPLPSREGKFSVLILVGHRPLVAAGENTFYGDIIKMIGAHNIVDGKTPYPTLNTEFITAKDPDVIIDLAMGSEKGGDLPEILRKKVITFDMSEFRAGPRIGEAVGKLLLSLRGTKQSS